MKKNLANDKNMPEKVKKELRENIKKMGDLINDIKKQQGPLENYGNGYHAAMIALGIE